MGRGLGRRGREGGERRYDRISGTIRKRKKGRSTQKGGGAGRVLCELCILSSELSGLRSNLEPAVICHFAGRAIHQCVHHPSDERKARGPINTSIGCLWVLEQ